MKMAITTVLCLMDILLFCGITGLPEKLPLETDCFKFCKNESCEDVCSDFISKLELSPIIDESAEANATLHCTNVNIMMINFNPGFYIIEQTTLENIWDAVSVNNGSLAAFKNLTAATYYRYRLRRVTENGISRPELTDWFSTYREDYQPLPLKNLYVSKIEPDVKNVCSLRAEFTFVPAKDRSCSYNVLYWDGEHNLINFNLRESPNFQFELERLDYDHNNTVSISAENDNSTKTSTKFSLAFVTPSCLEFDSNISICAPEQVEGLQGEHIYRHGNVYDVRIYWDKPEHQPDNYTVQLDLLYEDGTVYFLTVFGNATEVSFLNLELGPQYKISIVAKSAGGISLITSITKTVYNKPTTIRQLYPELLTAVLMVIIILVIVVTICLQHYKRQNRHFSMDYTHFESTIQKDGSVEATKKLLGQHYPMQHDDSAVLQDKFYLSPELLKLKNILGSGAYGIVRLGSLKDEFDNVTDVAVKMLKENPSVEDVKNFHQEILIMKSAGQHPNIVSLIGYCTLHSKPVLVVEYCSNGDLQSYLRTIWQNMVATAFDQRETTRFNPGSFIDSRIKYYSNNFGTEGAHYQNVHTIANGLYDIHQDMAQFTETITAGDQLNFARQIAMGMEFLSSNRIVHRDLATRNVLVRTDRVVKISDFGLSRDIYQENLYKKQSNGKLPLKWMAIEALTHQIYTTYSDVWSFGILLWEIVTMGALPYPGIPTDSILKLLKSNYRMERPPNCSIELYNVMVSCWNVRPQSRPTFTELKEILDKLLASYSENTYLNISDVLIDPKETLNEK